MKQQEA